ncbi:MAG: hypothetical protein AAF086_01040 [Planctomycetota bacterium]
MSIKNARLVRGLCAAAVLCPVPLSALEVSGVRYATTDQPVINAAFRFDPDGDYVTFETLVFDPTSPDLLREIESVNIAGVFFDTGASGNLISFTTSQIIGLEPTQFDPDGDGPQPAGPVFFNDIGIGIGGTEQFSVSDPVYVGLANVNAAVDPNVSESYEQTYGPIRFQIAAPPNRHSKPNSMFWG